MSIVSVFAALRIDLGDYRARTDRKRPLNHDRRQILTEANAWETAQRRFRPICYQSVLALGIAFVAGFAAIKTVAYDRRAGFVLFLLIGADWFIPGSSS